MLIATGTPDPPRGVTLFVQIPLAMSDLELQRIFEQPLQAWLSEQGAEFSLRCFELPPCQDHPAGIGIEVRADELDLLAFAIQKIADLGAPPETLIEIESDKATIEMTLAEAAGIEPNRNGPASLRLVSPVECHSARRPTDHPLFHMATTIPSAMPADELEVVNLRGIKIHARNFVADARDATAIRVTGADAKQIIDAWQGLPAGIPRRCHIPPFGLRFFREGRIICQGSICWQCNNIFGEDDGLPFFYNFNASSRAARELLALLNRTFAGTSSE